MLLLTYVQNAKLARTQPHTSSTVLQTQQYSHPRASGLSTLWTQPILAAHVLGLDRADPDDDTT